MGRVIGYRLNAHNDPRVLLACLTTFFDSSRFVLCSLTAETFYSRSMMLLITTFTRISAAFENKNNNNKYMAPTLLHRVQLSNERCPPISAAFEALSKGRVACTSK